MSSEYLWLLAMLCILGAGVCAAQASCYREQGNDSAAPLSVVAVALFVLSIIAAGAAWSVKP